MLAADASRKSQPRRTSMEACVPDSCSVGSSSGPTTRRLAGSFSIRRARSFFRTRTLIVIFPLPPEFGQFDGLQDELIQLHEQPSLLVRAGRYFDTKGRLLVGQIGRGDV